MPCMWSGDSSFVIVLIGVLSLGRWNYYYFFYNKTMKRVLFLSAASIRKGDEEEEDMEVDSLTDSGGCVRFCEHSETMTHSFAPLVISIWKCNYKFELDSGGLKKNNHV